MQLHQIAPSAREALAQTRALRFLSLAEVERKVRLKKSAIYALIRSGQFPAPVRVGLRLSAWVEHEVDAWMEKIIAASKEQAVL